MMRAKKSLGQHFLHNRRVIEKVISCGAVDGKVVLEIGPGTGSITRHLLERAQRVIAVEKDEMLATALSHQLADAYATGTLQLIVNDIRSFDLETIDTPYTVVANIPYYITGAILKKLLSANHQPERVVVLVQHEIAERIVQRDGKTSILSLSVAFFGTPRYIERIKPGAFSPPPKVDSALLCIDQISKENAKLITPEKFFTVIHAGFGQKRKQVAGNLSRAFSISKGDVVEVLKHCGLPSTVRAENISLSQWIRIAQSLTA